MINVYLAVALMFAHFVADFMCQTHWQATQKSCNNRALLEHVKTYTSVLVAFMIVFGAFGLITRMPWVILATCAFNGILHFGVDYVTSRWSKHFFKKEDFHNGFVVIGMDQFIHVSLLLVTASLWLV